MADQDHGAEPALDAEPGDLRVEFMNYLVTQFINSRAEFSGPHFNLGSQPEENKDTKTPVKKRVYKPRYSPKVGTLEKEVNKLKSKVHKKNKELQTTENLHRVKVIMARFERDKTFLKKIFEMMKKNKIQIDETAERKSRILSDKIDKIKNNIDEINGQDAENKDIIDQKIQKWERKEARARAKMEKSIEERSSLLHVAKEKAKQNIQAVKDEIEKFDLEIQNTKDAEDREVTNIRKNIKAKENTLAKIKDQCDKNIKRMIEKEVEKIADINSKIRNFSHDESKKKKEMDSNIALKRKAYDMLKRKTEDEKRKYHKKIDEYDKKIQQRAKEKKEIEADIRYFEEEKAREENEMKKEFELLRNNKQILEESIRAIQQDEAKKLGGMKAEIEALREKETLVKSKLKADIEQIQNELADTTQEVDKNIKAMEIQAVATVNEIEMRIQNMKEKEMEIEKNIKERAKKLEADEEGSEDRIVSMQRHVAQQEIEITNKIKIMQKREDEITKEYDAQMKEMQEIEVQIKIKMDQLESRKIELANKKAEQEKYIQAMETNTETAMEQCTAEEHILQLKTFIKAATKDSTGRVLNHCNTELDTDDEEL